MTDGVRMSTLPADTVVAGTEKLMTMDGTTAKTMTPAKIAEYTIDVLAATSVDSPVTTSDFFLAFRSGTEKLFDVDVLAEYVVGSGWDNASEVDPAASGDLILLERAGTIHSIDIDTIQTYVLDGVQADVLNISGLGAATLGATDLFMVCQGTTAKQVALSALETKLWTDYATYVAARSAVTVPVDSDKFYCLQGGVPKYVTLETIAEYVESEIGDTTPYQPWQAVEITKWTATPASTSQITMSDAGDFSVGSPVKYAYGGTTYYGIVTAIGGGTITIAGYPLDVGDDITALWVGRASLVTQLDLFVPYAYAAEAQDILSVTGRAIRWQKSKAYLVTYSATHGTADTGADQPKLNVKIDGDLVSTHDSNNGLQLSTAGTWVDHSAVAISANYAAERGDVIELRCTAAGTDGVAGDLSVSLVFVAE